MLGSQFTETAKTSYGVSAAYQAPTAINMMTLRAATLAMLAGTTYQSGVFILVPPKQLLRENIAHRSNNDCELPDNQRGFSIASAG
jgi:hypothetical protein